MSKTRIIKVKNASEYYHTWREKRAEYLESGGVPNLEDIKAEPDLLAAPEPKTSPELDAILELLNAGGLQKLTAIQQKIFQLSVVEGYSTRQVAEMMGFKSQTGVVKHLAAIRRKLEPLAVKLL